MNVTLETISSQILTQLSTLPAGQYLENKYIAALVILVLFALAAQIILWGFSKYLEIVAHRTKTKIDDLIFKHTKKPFFYLILVYGLKVAVSHLQWNGSLTNVLRSVMALLFILILSRTMDSIIEVWGTVIAKKTKTNVDEVLLPLFHKVVKVIFVIISFIWVLHIWSIDITPYLAGVGISGLVIGLALQDTLKNVFGSIAIILDKNFAVGDAIRLDSGETGTVEEIGLRSTKILTSDNEIIFVPNGQLANMKIRNFLEPNSTVRRTIDLRVEYGSDAEKIKKIFFKVVKNVKHIKKNPHPDIIILQMTDLMVQFQARFWVDWPLAAEATSEISEKFYQALRKENSSTGSKFLIK